MSGVKYSQIKLEQERKACQEALNSISALTGSIEGLKEKTRAILNQLPEGVKETFSGEIQRAKYWESKDIPIPSKEMNSTQLNKVAERLKEMNKAGREMLHLLIELKEVRRDEKARELIEKLEGLMAEIGGMKLLLNKWRQERYKELTKTLDGLSPMIEAGEFVKVGRGLSESERTLNELKTWVGSLEAQDNQRRYVLCSLRNVCKEMGWKEEEEPELKDKSDPGSPLVYKVKTYSAGTNVFYLTLEGIKVNSPIPTKGDTCYKDFDDLSEKLKKFGITTKFEREVSEEEPQLMQKGELDLPDEGIEMELERG